jgi:hypothetical protein
VSSAQRLIVAWTAGALASLLTFSLNPPERRGTAAPEPVPLAPARVADEPREAIKTYLQVHYDAVVYQEGGREVALAIVAVDGGYHLSVRRAPLRRSAACRRPGRDLV